MTTVTAMRFTQSALLAESSAANKSESGRKIFWATQVWIDPQCEFRFQEQLFIFSDLGGLPSPAAAAAAWFCWPSPSAAGIWDRSAFHAPPSAKLPEKKSIVVVQT